MQPSPSVLAWATAVMPGDEAASWCKEESLLEGWWVAAAVVPGGGGCPGAAAPSPCPLDLPRPLGEWTLAHLSHSAFVV